MFTTYLNHNYKHTLLRWSPVPQAFVYSTYLSLNILLRCSEPYFTMHTNLKLEFHQFYRECFTQKGEFISSNSGRILRHEYILKKNNGKHDY